MTTTTYNKDTTPSLILAGGCFWCLEYDFKQKDGILDVISGYIGGQKDNPTYDDICTGKSGHAEAIQVYYDDTSISTEEIIEYFLLDAHDPTQKDGQWVDIGPQYRSAIFYQDEEQKEIASNIIKRLDNHKIFKNPIVTSVVPATRFWPAETYHQDYYNKYSQKTGQCHIRVLSKVQRKAFSAHKN